MAKAGRFGTVLQNPQQTKQIRNRFLVKEISISEPNDHLLNSLIKGRGTSSVRGKGTQGRLRWNHTFVTVHLILEGGKSITIQQSHLNIRQIVSTIDKGNYKNHPILTTKNTITSRNLPLGHRQQPLISELNYYYLLANAKIHIDSYWYDSQNKSNIILQSPKPIESKKENKILEVSFENVEQLSVNDDNIRRYGILRRFIAHGPNEQSFSASDKVLILEYTEMDELTRKEYFETLAKSYLNFDYK